MLTPSIWLECLENRLGHITTNWDGMIILTGDMNIDLLGDRDTIATQYCTLLDIFGLKQIVSEPTRLTRTTRTLIDHIVTNMPSRVTHTGVIPCGIVSDHDGPFACVNIRVSCYQPRYKYTRSMKRFDAKTFLEDVAQLPLSLVYSSNDPDEQLEILNSLLTECIERHAPLRRYRMTRLPAPWMNCEEIRDLQSKRNKLRYEAHKTHSDTSWNAVWLVRNKLKTVIRKARKSFMETALSSSNGKKVWRVIHRVLKPTQQPLRLDPAELNIAFGSTASRTLNTEVTTSDDLVKLISNLPELKIIHSLNYVALLVAKY